MSQANLEVSEMRDALPASVHERLSDGQLRSGLDRAREHLGPGADEATVQGAAWILAHRSDQRLEQIEHMLQIATAREQALLEAERHLLGAFNTEPDLDDIARGATRHEVHDDLRRAESLLAALTTRAGGAVVITDQEMSDRPAVLIERADGGLRVIAFDLDGYLDNHLDMDPPKALPASTGRTKPNET